MSTDQHAPLPFLAECQGLGGATRYVEEIKEILADSPIFGGFSAAEVEALCGFMHCYAAERGGLLINQGDSGGFLLLVLTGSIDIFRCAADGRRVRMASVGPGATLGELSMIDGNQRIASCIADEPVDFALLTRAALNEMLLTYPRLGNKLLLLLLDLFAGRLRETAGTITTGMAASAV